MKTFQVTFLAFPNSTSYSTATVECATKEEAIAAVESLGDGIDTAVVMAAVEV